MYPPNLLVLASIHYLLHALISPPEREREREMSSKMQIVLVHGLCHGAWCWYKLSPLLRSAGHQVTTLDLSASGVHPKQLHEVNTFEDYSRPLLDLLDSLPSGERIVLVGHSLGGLNIALAMDRYPERIAAAVFLAALMPDTTSPPPSVFDWKPTFSEIDHPLIAWMDTEMEFKDGPEQPPTAVKFGPEMLSSKLYQLCSPEDLTLATTLMRPGSMFQRDLSSKPPFSEERYGSVDRVYVLCGQDAIIVEEHQLWMISKCPPKEVKTIQEADHMAMMSTPKEVCRCLLEVAESYA